MLKEVLTADVVVLGGGVGGCAAALAVAEQGNTVILTEQFRWLGGQLTSQAVPPDEHGWIETFGCTKRYRRLRNEVRTFYREHYPLTAEAAEEPRLNPGNGWVSPICHEPRVSLAVLYAMLAPHLSSGRLLILNQAEVRSVQLDGKDRIASATVSLPNGKQFELLGRFFLDATENGDVLPLAETECVTGSESRTETAEPSAELESRPDNVQALSVCFAMEHVDGADYVGEPPSDYGYWRNYQPQLTPKWPGKLLSWSGLNPRTMEDMRYHFDPHNEKLGLFSGLWAFRRIIDRSLFTEGFYRSDICLVNWPMIDYMEADILNCSRDERQRRLDAAKQLSLSMFYWLQTEAPRPDGGVGWPGLKLRGDITGTLDGLAMAPYIRESRRIQAITTILEQDVSSKYRPGETLAERYEDSVGVGYYRIDLHPSTGGDNYVDVPSLPFRIPLGALIPIRMQNLLAAAKNIGTTHITNGCYRLHPVEWNIGESAGLLAVHCLRKNVGPQMLHGSKDLLSEFQDWIRGQGIETEWPEDFNLDDGDPHAHAR